MSNFLCEHCCKEIIDSPNGYITECPHHPKEKSKKKKLKKIYKTNKDTVGLNVEQLSWLFGGFWC